MPRISLRTPRLDFVVIGAQKAGTTSLWRYLEGNPAVRMPPHKEASFFSEPTYPDLVRPYLRDLFKEAPRSARRGTVTPVYMLGVPGVSVDEIAERIRQTAPHARLVALLRDPVTRALSAHRMAVRDSGERRTFAQAIADQLQPSALESARRGPAEVASYVVGGEYGRMLEAYARRFPREQLLVERTSELERAPHEVVGRVCDHLGVPRHDSPTIGRRYFPSGRQRVSAEAESDLKDYLDRHVWPRVRHGEDHRSKFDFWFRLWNVEPDPGAPSEQPDEATASRLREHYAADAERLEAVIGFRADW